MTAIRHHPIHYIIQAPKSRSRMVFLRDGVMTFLVWAMYLYFMRDFFLFIGSFAAWAFHGFADMDAYPRLKILVTIGGYTVISAVLTTLFIGWALYNYFRFRNKHRRKFKPRVSARELALTYNTSAQDVSAWQKSRVLVMHHDAKGRLIEVVMQE